MNIKKLLYVLMGILISLFFDINAKGETSISECREVSSIIEEFNNKGLIDKRLIEIIKTREEFSKVEWARIVDVLVQTFNYTKATKEDLSLLGKLVDEVKYELLLINVQKLEDEIRGIRNRPELAGKLQFTFDSYGGELPFEKEEFGKIPSPSRINIKQKIDLYLRTSPTQLLSLFIKLQKTGYWGARYSPEIPQTGGSLYIDDVYFKTSTIIGDIKGGRIRFSFGHIGLLISNEFLPASPLEGFEFVSKEIKKIKIINVIGRITSDYYPNSLVAAGKDNFVGARLSTIFKGSQVGTNYLNTGLGKEKGYSIDLLTSILKSNIFGEYVRFKISPDTIGVETIEYTDSYILGAKIFNFKNTNCEIRYGNIDKYFWPIYSSLYYSEVGAKTNFKNDAKGYEFSLSHKFKWMPLEIEQFSLQEKTTHKKEYISVFRCKKDLLGINFNLEYNRFSDNKIWDKKYDQLQLITTINF